MKTKVEPESSPKHIENFLGDSSVVVIINQTSYWASGRTHDLSSLGSAAPLILRQAVPDDNATSAASVEVHIP